MAFEIKEKKPQVILPFLPYRDAIGGGFQLKSTSEQCHLTIDLFEKKLTRVILK